MQMAVPQLRSSANVRLFNSQLLALDHDLEVGGWGMILLILLWGA